MPEVKCFVCGAVFDVDEEKVGRTILCPGCRYIFVVRKKGNKFWIEYPEIDDAENMSTRNIFGPGPG